MNKRKSVIFCGYNVFPYGYAQTQRLLLEAKGLDAENCRTLVLCRYGTYNSEVRDVSPQGIFEGIKYIYCSGSPFRPKSFLKRNLFKVLGVITEFIILLKSRLSGKLDYIFVTTNSIDNVLYYAFVAKILFTKSVIDNVEFWSAVKRHKWEFGERLQDNLSPIIYSKVICISDFLADHARKFRKDSDILKIPAIVEYEKFNVSEPTEENKNKDSYIMFCGSAVYFPVIDFIIEAFEQTKNELTTLLLVSSNGSTSDFAKVNNRISTSTKKERIRLLSKLQYGDLVKLYKNSIALLIPLRSNEEDRARFPHKLGEYCAAKAVIVTTNNGEVPNYFTDGENALIASRFNAAEFAEKIDIAVSENEKLMQMRLNAYSTGLRHFDYRANGEKIYKFLFN